MAQPAGSHLSLIIRVSLTTLYVCAAMGLASESLATYGTKLLRLKLSVAGPQDPNTTKDRVWADKDWYRLGGLDYLTVSTFAIGILLMTTAFDDLLGIPVLGSCPEPRKMSRLILHLMFEVGSFGHSIWAGRRGHFTWSVIWNGYANSEMPFIAKFFFTMQAAYYMHVLLYNALMSVAGGDSVPYRKNVYFILFVHVVATAFARNSLLPVVILLMIPHSIISATTTLGLLFDNAMPAQLNPNTRKVEFMENCVRYASVAECAWLVIGAGIIGCKGDAIPLPLRFVVLVASVLWAIWGSLNCYFEVQQRRRPTNPVRQSAPGKKTKPKAASKRRP